MSQIQLWLKSIECQKLSEANDDELYCYVFLLDDKGDMDSEHRFPENGIWRFHHGERKEINQLLFTHTEGKTNFLSIAFKEEDLPDFNITRKIAEFIRSAVHYSVPEIVDDFLGTIFAALLPDLSLTWKASLNTVTIEDANSGNLKPFVLIHPNHFQYSVVFEIKKVE